MFETIDQIDWRALNDAYGPSVGTPQRIRDLASPNPGTRERACRDLGCTIYHQGTIYAASVAAVPFLFQIVASAEVADRAPTLGLLKGLSNGTSYHESHGSLIFYQEESKTPEWQEQVRIEKGWVAAIHERLIAAVPTIAAVLAGGRPAERVAAASLLGTLQDQPAAVEALVNASSDPATTVSATAIIALGANEDAPAAVLERCFEEAPTELVRSAAAIHLLYHRQRASPSAAVDHLVQQLRAPQPELREAYGALPDAGEFLGDVGKALAVAPRASAAEAFPLLYEQVKQSRYPRNPSETFGVLILAMMLDPPPEGKWTAVALTREQRLAIRLVAERAWTLERGIPTTHGNLTDLLESVGLPGKREEVFALLAGTPEGAQTPQEERRWSSRKRRRWWRFW